MWISVFIKVYSLFPDDVKAGWTPTVCDKHQQCTKPASGKIMICSYSSLSSYSSHKINLITGQLSPDRDTKVYLTSTDWAYLLARYNMYKLTKR